MVLRINHNTAVMNAHRNVTQNAQRLMKSLEQMSSGMKINRASDSPSGLIISEQMRAQISGLQQAADNSEVGIGMVQTAEAALGEVSALLVNIRQLATHAANEGATDEVMLRADQMEIDNALDTIDRITAQTQFGVKRILDGSQGANGVTTGEGLEFVKAGPMTKNSPVQGYPVRVFRLGSQASVEGQEPLTEEMIGNGEELTVAEGGRVVSIRARPGDTVASMLGRLRNEMTAAGMNLELTAFEDNILRVSHRDYGSAPTFFVASTSPGVLSSQGGVLEEAVRGQDIQGTLGGHMANGRGQKLTGGEGTPVEALQVRYTGTLLSDPSSDDPDDAAGRVAVYQNSLVFQVGGNADQQVSVSLNNTNTRKLGGGVKNASGFRNLREVSVMSTEKANDTIRLVTKAIDDVTFNRAELGAFQKNALESNLTQLRIVEENLASAESTIRDTDMAEAAAEYTRNSILVQSSSAMMAQANQVTRTVLTLLD